jgi:hypothetical protein
LKIKLNQAITSQHATSSDDLLLAYKGLLTEVANAIYPIKDLITNEARLQAILNGLFSSYSDLKLQETSRSLSNSAKVIIIPEFQTGAGGRVDMVIQGIGPSSQGTKEYQPIALELKLIDKDLDKSQPKSEVDKLTQEQNARYAKGAALKTITDSDKMFFMGIVVNIKAKDKNSLILTSDELVSAVVVHSSVFDIEQQRSQKKLKCGSLNQSSRKRRSTNNCLFSWEDIDKFSTEKTNRDIDKIEIDSEKFINYLSTEMSEDKRAQLIDLATHSKVSGSSKSKNSWLKSLGTQQKIFIELSDFLTLHFPHAKMTPIKQSFYLPQFKKVTTKSDHISIGIHWAFSKLSANEHELFLQNLGTLKQLHPRLLRGQPISSNEYKEYFKFKDTLHELSEKFKEKSDLQNNKKLSDLKDTIDSLIGDFTIHLIVGGNRVVIQRRNNLYSYLDSSMGYIDGLKESGNNEQEAHEIEVLQAFEEANILSNRLKAPDYSLINEIREDSFSIELVDQEEASQAIQGEEKQTLISLLKLNVIAYLLKISS